MPERSPKGRENFSRKREAILNALRDTDAHPTAEWVYRRLKPEYPDLSLGTVYRNLGRFTETGQAVSLGVIAGHERFDGDTEPHAHLVCERCGAVMDVYGALPGEGELESISERSGCRIESASLTFRGLCRDCLKGVQIAGEEKDSGAEKSDL